MIAQYGTVDRNKAADLYREVLVQFSGWFQDVPEVGRTLPWFTTNYDMAVESAAEVLGLRVYDSFRNGPSSRLWHWNVFGEYVEDPSKVNIVLVKLHGSVSWVAREVEPNQLVLAQIPPDMQRDPGGYKHTLLYPTLGPKQVRVEPYRTNYDCLRQCLLGAKFLIAIGTSFRDPELNEELRRGLEDNPGLHLVSVSPGANDREVARTIQAEGSEVELPQSRGSLAMNGSAHQTSS